MTQTFEIDARTVVTAYFEALDDGDLEALRRSFAPGATWTMPGDLPTSGTYTGAAQIIDGFLARMLERLEPGAPVTRDVRSVIGDGDVATVEWTARATARTGEPYVNDYCAVFETVGDKITAVREYCDTSRMAAVLFSG